MSEIQIFNGIVLATMFALGAIFGSFACCQAWRWRYLVHKEEPWSVVGFACTVARGFIGMIISRLFLGWFCGENAVIATRRLE